MYTPYSGLHATNEFGLLRSEKRSEGLILFSSFFLQRMKNISGAEIQFNGLLFFVDVDN